MRRRHGQSHSRPRVRAASSALLTTPARARSNAHWRWLAPAHSDPSFAQRVRASACRTLTPLVAMRGGPACAMRADCQAGSPAGREADSDRGCGAVRAISNP
jgi:hypothetical protein